MIKMKTNRHTHDRLFYKCFKMWFHIFALCVNCLYIHTLFQNMCNLTCAANQKCEITSNNLQICITTGTRNLRYSFSEEKNWGLK